jgi:hypothetical protein
MVARVEFCAGLLVLALAVALLVTASFLHAHIPPS